MSRVLPRHIEVLVASFGGVGTTFLTDFIARWRVTNDRDDLDGFKHLYIPPVSFNPRIRFVYVFGDPVTATISLFRRGYQVEQSRKLLLAVGRDFAPLTAAISLADYAAAGVDRLLFAEHFANWYDRYLLHPTLFVRYDALWDQASRIVRFLGLPPEAARGFPPHQARRSDPAGLPAEVLSGLERLYDDFRHRLDSLGDCRLRGAPPQADTRSRLASPSFRAFLRGGVLEQGKFWTRQRLPEIHLLGRGLMGGLPVVGRRYRDVADDILVSPPAGAGTNKDDRTP